jgi:hypothetical protein
VSADRIAGDTFRIRARGNGNTDPAVIQDFALLRAAETVRAHCFTHFVVLEGADRTEVEEGSTPDEHTTKVVEKVVDGKTEKVVTRSFTPGSSWTTVRPGSDLIVRGLRGASLEGAVAAEEVLAFVGPRVRGARARRRRSSRLASGQPQA